MEKLYHWKKYPTNSFNYVYLMVELENRFKFISKTLKKMQKKTILQILLYANMYIQFYTYMYIYIDNKVLVFYTIYLRILVFEKCRCG